MAYINYENFNNNHAYYEFKLEEIYSINASNVATLISQTYLKCHGS